MGSGLKNNLLTFWITCALTVLAPFQALASGALVKAVRVDYSSTNVTASAFTTIVSAVSGTTYHVVLGDSSGKPIALAWASACGSLATTTQTLFIWPSTTATPSVISADLVIPDGSCVGIKSLNGTASTGELDLTLTR